ncbi:MAG: hypothetical protein ACI35W_06345, partial [Anaeroplasmataceae bacterium]
MKDNDSNEFYNSKENKQISEYKSFSAEQYYSFEISKSPLENYWVKEINNDESKKDFENKKDDTFDKLRKQLENNQGDSSIQGSNVDQGFNATETQIASTTSSTASSTATVSSSAASSTAAASTGATIAASAVIVVAAVTGLFSSYKKYIDVNSGADYSAITLNLDELIKEDSKIHGYKASDFTMKIVVGEDVRLIDLVSGKHTYLVTGLAPNETYSYDILCKSSVYYSDQITTSDIGEPCGIYDELNNSISYNDEVKSASVAYSIYLSDYEKKFTNSTLYVCSEEQDDFLNIKNVIYTSNALNEDNYFKGTIDGITYSNLYYYLVGHGSEEKLLFSYYLDTNIPEDWCSNNNLIFDIDESSISYTYSSDNILIAGNINNYDNTKIIGVDYTEYNSSDEVLIENKEAIINIDSINNTFEISLDLSYGLSSYEYVIYFLDENSSKINVYESGVIAYAGSQEFSATYTKVEPSDAT